MLVGWLGACSGSHEPSHDRAIPTPETPRNAPELDVPSLLGLSIDALSQRVGPRQPLPAGFADPTLVQMVARHEKIDSTALFRSGSLALVVSYDYRTRRVSDVLLLGNNEEDLMGRAHLQVGSARYLVLPVFQERHPTKLLGLRVLAVSLRQ
ncbi:MAG: hypothetical protein NVS3B25_13590 [Hymenobacter sp.]